jgi:uncharacterized protein (DUF488 family)
MRLYTIGHSTHPIEVFAGLLSRHQIQTLIDIRSYPSSKRWPQFNQEALRESSEQNGVAYHWLRGLGGRRRVVGESLNDGWEHPAFRAYADYIAGADGQASLRELIGIAGAAPSAIMCSEGLWWQCHRRIVSDYMLLHGWEVIHVMPDGKPVPHHLTPFARMGDQTISYRAIDDGLG